MTTTRSSSRGIVTGGLGKRGGVSGVLAVCVVGGGGVVRLFYKNCLLVSVCVGWAGVTWGATYRWTSVY
jgi:hypothetical protein